MTTLTLENLPSTAASTAPLSVNGERYVVFRHSNNGTTGNMTHEVLLLARCDGNGNSKALDDESYNSTGVGSIATTQHTWADSCLQITVGSANAAGIRDYYYWQGAKINPTPVSGKFYRTLGTTNGGQSALVQYWDEDSADRRFHENNAWNIVYGTDAPWFNDRDSYHADAMDTIKYVEVELTEASMFAGKATEEVTELSQSEEAAPVLAPAPAEALGLAKHNADGTLPELNQQFESGVLHVAWWTGRSNGNSALLCDGVDSERLYPVSMVNRQTDGSYTITDWDSGNVWTDSWSWLPAIMPTVTIEPLNAELAEAQVSAFRSRLGTAESEFQQFNEDLNEIAKDKEWCSEYEGSITPYGMKPREEEMKDWDVEVRASVSVTIDSPSSDIDRTISNDTGMSMELTRMTFDTSVLVTVRVSCASGDDAYDQVDTQMVEDAIVNSMAGSPDIEVDDYECVDYEEAD